MAIQIIVEDGTLVANANSYDELANIRTFASNRGVTLPVDDDELAVMVLKAMDYIEAQACRFQGSLVSSSQALQWPRNEVVLNGDYIPNTLIPNSLKNALAQLVVVQNQGFEIQPNFSPQDYVKKEKVGPIETEYSDPLKVGIMPTFTAVEAFLAPLFGQCAENKFALRTIRV